MEFADSNDSYDNKQKKLIPPRDKRLQEIIQTLNNDKGVTTRSLLFIVLILNYINDRYIFLMSSTVTGLGLPGVQASFRASALN